MMLGGKNSMRRNLLTLLIASPWLLVALVRLLALDHFWPLVPIVAFTPQTLMTLALPLIVALLLRARWTAVVLLVAAAALAVVVVPRTTADEQPAARGAELRVVTANLLHGSADPIALLETIHAENADVVTLQETSAINITELRRLGLLATHPYLQRTAAEGMFANYTISRTPLKMLPGGEAGAAGWPGMRVSGFGVSLYNFHSRSPLTPSRESEWSDAIASLPGSQGHLRVIAGDFNATLDHRAFRALLARGYRDAGDVTGNGLVATWTGGAIARLAIDHVLVPPGVRVARYRVYDLPRSDHKAVAATLVLPAQ